LFLGEKKNFVVMSPTTNVEVSPSNSGGWPMNGTMMGRSGSSARLVAAE
jgi:hypothetical protein